MLDIIGAISLTALFGICAAFLLISSPIDARTRSRLATIAVIWFVIVGGLAAFGVFAADAFGTMAIGLAVLVPVVFSLISAARSSFVRGVALEIPLALLVAIHAGRVLGVFFLLLLDAGRLPSTFALAAGWGDVIVGGTALPLAWLIHHRVAGWRTLTAAWNLFGTADLVTAVTLGIGSAPNSPVRFIFESSNTIAVATLPWVIVPAVLVPLYLVTHFAIFAQLGRAMVVGRHWREAVTEA